MTIYSRQPSPPADDVDRGRVLERAVTVAQLWCPKCKAEVVARVHDDASGERRTARCPWCDHAIDVPEEAAA